MRVDIRAILRPSASDLNTGHASFITLNEPSIGMVGDQVLLTGNMYAARSLDRGATWSPIDPYSYLHPGPPTEFCCDQTVYYDAAHDLTLWLLQYKKSDHDNTLRVAVKQGATLDDDDWLWLDLTPTTLDATWTDEWLDYNHASSSADHLFIGSNVFGVGDKSVFRSVVLRISFESIFQWMATGTPFDLEVLQDRTCGTLRARRAQPARCTSPVKSAWIRSGFIRGPIQKRMQRGSRSPCRHGVTARTRLPVRMVSTGSADVMVESPGHG